MRIQELAQILDAAFEGDGALDVTRVSSIERAGPNDLAFAAGTKAVQMAEWSSAGCLLVGPGFTDPAGRNVIRVPDPRAAIAQVISVLYPPAKHEAGVHPSAVVSADAVLGEGVSVGPKAVIGEKCEIGADSVIGPGCVLGRGVKLGDRCLLHANVSIYDGVEIGARAVLHSGAVIGADGFGFVMTRGRYQKFPQIGGVRLGDDVEVGANACIDRAALGMTEIGDGVKIDNMVHIGHNCNIGKHVVIAAQTGLSGGVTVGDYAVIGGQVGIGDKARIESGAVLGSGCGILTSKIVRAGQVVWGTPARPLKQHLQQLASLTKLPEVRKQVEELRQAVQRLADRVGKLH